MRFGLVLSLYAYNEQRVLWAKAGFESLQKTITPSEVPVLYIIEHPQSLAKFSFGLNGDLQCDFETSRLPDPPGVSGSDRIFAYGAGQLLSDYPDVTHIVWMCDDILVHPSWLIELEALISRHPTAKAWSVRRSAHVQHHAPLAETQFDVQVRSLDGLGLTVTREEWLDFGVTSEQGDFTNPVAGNTLDLYHAYYRSGERWCTKRSYLDHTGSIGIHVGGILEHYASVDFVGTGEDR